MTAATPSARGSELLVVMVKLPVPGRVKTRLAVGVGEERATEIYRALVAATLEAVGDWLQGEVGAGGAPVDRRVWVSYDPPEQEEAVRGWLGPTVAVWPTPVGWVGQAEGDLGARLQEVFTEAFKSCFSAVCVIGTDCPYLTGDDLRGAFRAMEEGTVVLGPAVDGGYYLMGLKTQQNALFDNIPWSTEATLAATCDVARRLGLKTRLLRRLADVDTAEEWRAWETEGRNLKKSG